MGARSHTELSLVGRGHAPTRDAAVIALSDDVIGGYALDPEDRVTAGALLESGLFELIRITDGLAAGMAELRARRAWLARHLRSHVPCPRPGCRVAGALRVQIARLARQNEAAVHLLATWSRR